MLLLTRVTQSQFIEGGGVAHEEKEWYYGNKEKERFGPYSVSEVGRVFMTLKVAFHAS